jgi:3-oxoadipate enol-lactonase
LKTHKIARGAHTIQYHELGAGEPIVLIQGLGMPGVMWRDLADELTAHNLRVIMPDSRVPTWAFTVEDMADDVAAVLDHAGEADALVLGYSLGGMIAQHVALRHPKRVRGLLLAATTCGLPHGVFPAPGTIWGLLKLFLRPRDVTPAQVQAVMTHPDATPRLAEIFAQIEDKLKIAPTPPQTIIGQLLAATQHSSGFRLKQIKAPTWVVTGDSDALIPSRNGDILAARIPGARLHVVPRTGHLFAYERPGALRDLLLDWRAHVNQRAAT